MESKNTMNTSEEVAAATAAARQIVDMDVCGDFDANDPHNEKAIAAIIATALRSREQAVRDEGKAEQRELDARRCAAVEIDAHAKLGMVPGNMAFENGRIKAAREIEASIRKGSKIQQ